MYHCALKKLGHWIQKFLNENKQLGSIHKLRQAKIELFDPPPLPVSRLGEVSPIDNTLASSAPKPPPLPDY